MNIINISDFKKQKPVELIVTLPMQYGLTDDEFDKFNELLGYFNNIEDSHSVFKILSSLFNTLILELTGTAVEPHLVIPLNDNHPL